MDGHIYTLREERGGKQRERTAGLDKKYGEGRENWRHISEKGDRRQAVRRDREEHEKQIL